MVDDDLALREALQELLIDEGYFVEVAPDGLAALNRLHDGYRPAVILLDLMMPVMDGWQFRAKQLAEAALKDIPVLVLTAANINAQTARAQLRDVTLLAKPFDHDALVALIAAICSKRARDDHQLDRSIPDQAPP